MKQEHVTASSAEAQRSCAFQVPTAFESMGTIELQPYFKPVTRRAIMAAVNTVSKDLGLRPASVIIVDALLSCLPCKDSKTGAETPITSSTLLTVFAANSTLCFRAKGITDRQLRRHLERLEEAGLIQRRDSANGKRFPIQRGGKIIGAFGIDLSPLLARSEELTALAQQRRQEADELRGLKSYIQKLRSDCLHLRLDEEATAFVEATRNLMRRAGVTLIQARDIINRLKAVLKDAQPDNSRKPAQEPTPANLQHRGTLDHSQPDTTTLKKTASDGQNVRHKDPSDTYTKKTHLVPAAENWKDLSTVSEFFPDVPRSKHKLLQIVFEFGRMLRIGQDTLAKAVSTMGCMETLQAQDRIASKANEISNPENYLARIIASSNHTRVGHGQHCEIT